MMIPYLIGINTIIFTLIALLHIYWVFGGMWGIEAAVPKQFLETYYSKKTEMAIATFVVALGLFGFALVTLLNYEPINWYIDKGYIRIGTGIISAIFFIRAIGDFNFFGFFKKQKEGRFAEKDSQFFSPLCLFISIISLLILIL